MNGSYFIMAEAVETRIPVKCNAAWLAQQSLSGLQEHKKKEKNGPVPHTSYKSRKLHQIPAHLSRPGPIFFRLYGLALPKKMEPILFEIRDSVACITLNRPDKFNSFNREMALQLQAALDECKKDSVRAVYMTGNGKAFSAGQDISELVGEHKIEIRQILSEHFNPVVTRILELEKPVLAAVNGVAAGAGANLAICCDITVATASATFIQAFSKIGLVPDTGGSFFLPRRVGWQRATALMMLGDKVPAAEAEKMGMIYKCFPDEDFQQESMEMARTLSRMPTRALYLIKKELRWSSTHTIYEQLQNEDKLQQWAAQTEDYKEGIASFLEKRAPVFKGR